MIPHPSDAPEFAFEKGDAFRLSASEPEEAEAYIYVLARVWNYDPRDRPKNARPADQHHKQYKIGDVIDLGTNSRLITESDLLDHYEPVPKEVAQMHALGVEPEDAPVEGASPAPGESR